MTCDVGRLMRKNFGKVNSKIGKKYLMGKKKIYLMGKNLFFNLFSSFSLKKQEISSFFKDITYDFHWLVTTDQ